MASRESFGAGRVALAGRKVRDGVRLPAHPLIELISGTHRLRRRLRADHSAPGRRHASVVHNRAPHAWPSHEVIEYFKKIFGLTDQPMCVNKHIGVGGRRSLRGVIPREGFEGVCRLCLADAQIGKSVACCRAFCVQAPTQPFFHKGTHGLSCAPGMLAGSHEQRIVDFHCGLYRSHIVRYGQTIYPRPPLRPCRRRCPHDGPSS